MRQSASGTNTGVNSADTGYEWVLRNTVSVWDLMKREFDARPSFRAALHEHALELIRDGDAEAGNAILARYFPDDTAPQT